MLNMYVSIYRLTMSYKVACSFLLQSLTDIRISEYFLALLLIRCSIVVAMEQLINSAGESSTISSESSTASSEVVKK